MTKATEALQAFDQRSLAGQESVLELTFFVWPTGPTIIPSRKVSGSRKMQKAALVTREAHQALLDLKS
jgi:hypothetical protein